MINKNTKIVCLGGGIGTVNLIRGLKEFSNEITIVISMADEGGSSGRLRRIYNTLPPGDLISCMAAMCNNDNTFIQSFLTYRFPGDRYAKDEYLAGHKLGNLMMVATTNLTGNFNESIKLLKNMFNIPGTFLPATNESVTISAQTIEGKVIYGEEKIDLGKYNGKRILDKVFLHPENAKTSSKVINSLDNVDVIIAGPGDLYTTTLPVMIVPEIAHALKRSKALKLFVINVANKPFETKGYKVVDYIDAVVKHLGSFPFNKVIVNSNMDIKIPKKFHYNYVKFNKVNSVCIPRGVEFIEKDLIDEEFPLYHSSKKLAKAVNNAI